MWPSIFGHRGVMNGILWPSSDQNGGSLANIFLVVWSPLVLVVSFIFVRLNYPSTQSLCNAGKQKGKWAGPDFHPSLSWPRVKKIEQKIRAVGKTNPDHADGHGHLVLLRRRACWCASRGTWASGSSLSSTTARAWHRTPERRCAAWRG